MKRWMFLLAFLISIGTSAFGQLVKEVTLSSTTNLAAALANEEPDKITTLKISGPLTAADFTTMKNNMAMLQVLDMSGVTELPDKSIPSKALQGKLTLQQVVFPACLNTIKSYAFDGCSNLLTADFSQATALSQIEYGAFKACSGLQSVNIVENAHLTSIGQYAFYSCNNLKSVNLSGCASLQTIATEAFRSCSSLQTVDLSNCAQLKTIGSYAFWSCSVLSKVMLTGCVALQSIENNAFYWCSSLSDFDFTQLTALSSIGSSAFNGTALSGEIKFASSINQLDESAFRACGNITHIDLSNSAIAVVSANTFADCTKLQTVDFTGCASLNTLNKEAFCNCLALQKVVIENSFYKSVDDVLYVVDMATLMLYPAGKEDPEFTIPNSVLTIQSSAFPYNNNLKTLTIPATVMSIQQSAFDGFGGKSVYVMADQPIGLSNDIGLGGALVYVPKGALNAYKEAAIWKDYTLIETGAEGTIVDLETAGSLSAKLTELGVSLNTIQELTVTGPMNASDFEIIKQMTLLTKVDLSGTTMEENRLPNNAFKNLSYLKEVKLPDEITVIGEYAFADLSNLEIVNLPTSLETISRFAFAGCSNLKEIDLSALTHLESIGSSSFRKCGAIPATLKLPNSLKEISTEAFSMTKVTSVDFSNTSLKGIGSWAFYECRITGDLSFPTTLTYIYDKAFNFAKPSSIKLKSAKMVSLNSTDVFNATDKTTCKVYVPKGLGATYKADTYWSPFGDNIEEFGNLVTVTTNNSFGYTMGGGAYEAGETVTLKAVQYDYYENVSFSGWYENGQRLSTDLTYSFTMDEKDHAIEARFMEQNVQISDEKVIDDSNKVDGQSITLQGRLLISGSIALNINSFAYYQGASLVVESPVTAEQVKFFWNARANVWHFISLPYDLNMSDIKVGENTQFVVREYDGASRSKNGVGSSWKQLSVGTTLKAYKGYIIQFNSYPSTYLLNAASGMEALFNRSAVTIPLTKHASSVTADANWNLEGNPFPCYFSVKQLFNDGLDGTVTVWSDQIQNYEYYTKDDEDVYLAPLTAFFIQHNQAANVTFKPEGRVATLPTTRAAVADLRSDAGREVINLQLANDSLSDKTRLVFNEAASTDYELGKDAAKFSSLNNNAPSLYTLDAQNQQLAINERPVGNGVVRLGCYIGVKGSYTISAKEALVSDLYLYDAETGAFCNLREESYAFTAEAGICNNRFELRTALKGTGIEAIEGLSWQVEGNHLQLNGLPAGAQVSLFDANGRAWFAGDAATATQGIALPQSGIYYLTIRTAEGRSFTEAIKR